MADKPKRTYPSGAAKRKAKKERETALVKSQQLPSYSPFSSPNTLSSYYDPKGAPLELPIYGVPPATVVVQISSYVTQLEQGGFWGAAGLIDGMNRDDRVASTLSSRIGGLLGCELEMRPAVDDDDDGAEELAGEAKQAAQIAEDCEDHVSRLLPANQLEEIMRHGLMLGTGIAQIIEVGDYTTISVWNARQLYFDWSRRRYVLTSMNKGQIVLEPVNGVDYTDGAISINPGEQPTRWVVYEPFGPRAWVSRALVRAMATPWLIRYWSRQWWARHQEVHGQPMRLGILPAERTPQDEALFLSQLSNLAHEAVIRLPQGSEDNRFDVKLLEASANTWEGFQKILEHCDDSIAILLLGQRQSTRGQGGLGTQENAGQDTMLKLTRRDSKLGEVLRDQVLKAWVAEEYGNEDLAPFIEWQFEPPEDEAEAADVDLKVSQALVYFDQAKAPLDVRAFLQKRGYPLLTPEQEAKQKADKMAEAQEMAKTLAPPPGKPDKPPTAAEKLRAATDALVQLRLAGRDANPDDVFRAIGVEPIATTKAED